MRALLPFFMLFALQSNARADDASAAFQKQVLPILTAHCTECHSGEKAKAKLGKS